MDAIIMKHAGNMYRYLVLATPNILGLIEIIEAKSGGAKCDLKIKCLFIIELVTKIINIGIR